MTDDPKQLAADGFASIEEAGEFLSLCRSKIYTLMESGRLPNVKLDGARRIPRRALVEFAENLLAGAK